MSVFAMRATLPPPVAVFVALLLGAVPAITRAQEPKPAELSAATLSPDGSIVFTYLWRYHPGDDPSWAEPQLDDAAWGQADPLLPTTGLPRGGWSGAGWFRRHLLVDSTLWARPLVLRVEGPGATQVYLDGELLLNMAPPSTVAGDKGRPAGGGWCAFSFSRQRIHVLSLRHSCRQAEAQAPGGLGFGFRLSLEDASTIAQHLAGEPLTARRDATLATLFIAVPGVLALLHLALFWSFPKARENLFYALSMLGFVGVVLCGNLIQYTSDFWRDVADRLNIPFVLLAMLSILLMYYSLRTRSFPRTWKVFVGAAAVLALAAAIYPHPPMTSWAWYLFFAAIPLEVARLARRRLVVRREGIGVIVGAMIVQAVIVLLQVLANIGLIPQIFGWSIYLFVVIPMAIGMSIFLARDFARTNRHLQRRIEEVEALSDQVVAQMKRAHEQELRQRLLEADNARKSAELEAARALQLSMLPTSLPDLAGLDVAVAMSTASEVGGDYYDFRATSADTLVVAVGDATGHGVAAGTMVTAVKALFATLAGEAHLAAILVECDRVLRGMNVKPLHMCLALGRISPRAMTLCSAGMPRVLVWRASTGKVEELGTGGLPLGSHLSPTYQERSTSLGPGDTLLLATDGFSEQASPEGQPVGFEGAAHAFAAACGGPAREVVDRLSAVVRSWRRTNEQTDDITFVVVRVTT
ncbi:MAG: SpoIIE family protein phosphatase [Thermoanaerobaculales bacterium]